MKDQSKNNLLYFEDDEIVTGKTENKKVFVTKRINGKETHIKQKKAQKQETPRETEYRRVPNTQGFNFEREIVIGVNNSKKAQNNNSFNNPNSYKKNKNTSKNTKKEGKHSKSSKKINKDNIKKKSKIKEKNSYAKPSKNKKSNYDFYEDFNDTKNKRKIKKNKGKNKFFITIISLLSMTIALIIMALITPAFNIQEIKVEGNNKVPTANIINLSRIKIGQNIFKNNKKKISNYIKENTYIENAEIKRILPSTIIIEVKERKVDYQVKLISSYIYLDKKGNILENSENKENVIILEGLTTSEETLINGKKLNQTDTQNIYKIEKVTEGLKKIEGLDLSEVKINIKNENDFIIYLKNENKKIYIGDGSDLSNKMLYIKKILENEKDNSGTIFINGNLNEGFKPYFREEEYKE